MTKLQELRLKNNMSQSELARASGVNYRTLQDFDQGRKSLANAKGEMLYRLTIALGCSIDELMSDHIEIMPDFNISMSSQAARLQSYVDKLQNTKTHYYGEFYSFPVIIPCKGVKMEYIYPTKQRLVASIHDALTPRPEISAVMLFGSSITMRCTSTSDTDLSIRLYDEYTTSGIRDEISEIVQNLCDWNADIIWFDRINPNDRVYHDICKGVQIV